MSKKDSQSNNKKTENGKKQTQNKLKKFFFTNAFGILCSRIFGFIRDALQASLLGTSIYSDIFFIAFKFPNMFRRVVSEGAFVQSFLPFLLSARNKGAFSISIFFIFLFLLTILSGLVMWFAPFITKLLALGFNEDRILLATPLVRIHFWYLILIFVVTYLSTLLQYKNIFWVNAYNTVLLNLAMIGGMVYAKGTDKDLLDIVYILSYSVLIGGIAQIFIHFYPLYTSKIWLLQYVGYKHLKKWWYNSGAIFRILPFGIYFVNFTSQEKCKNINTQESGNILHHTTTNYQTKYVTKKMQTAPQGDSDLQHKNITRFNNAQKAKIRILLLLRDIKAFFTAFLPAMLGASSAQIIAIIDSSLVTLLPDSEGGVSVLNFANRIFQLPLALFAIAISSALFPMVAKAIKVRDTQNALHALKAAFWFLLITLSICTIGGIMLRNEIIWLLFERGNFTHKDTIMVGYAFVGYMIGLIPFGLARIFSLWLYSHKKQAKAAKISVIALFIGVMLSAIFILSIYYFEIQSGIIWELRYCFMALFGSIGGFALLFFNIKEFGVYNFFVIISHTKYMLLLCGASFVTFVLIKLFQCFFSIK